MADNEARIIDSAYGLVLGAFDGLTGKDDKGYARWKETAIQDAAMKAAKAFIAELEKIEARK